MDAIKFWSDQVALWNAESFCGKCWVFGAPLSKDMANKQQTEDDNVACVHVLVTNYSEQIRYKENRRTGMVNKRDADYAMEVHFVIRDDIGRNMYNEILGHPISESKWAMILKPLRDCITPENTLKLCEIAGINVLISRWSMTVQSNWLDNNYTGWKLNVTFSTVDE